MFAASKARTAQVQTPTGWVNTGISQIQPGQTFRMVRPDGSIVPGTNGATEFVAGDRSASVKTAMALRAHVREKFTNLLSVRPAAFA